MSESSQRTRTAAVSLGADGVLRSVVLEGAIETLDDAQSNIAAAVAVAGGRRRPVLVDFRGIRGRDRAARVYYAGPEAARVCAAVALWIESPLSRVIGNFFLGLNKPEYPMRVFGSEAEALSWLMGYVDEV